MLDVSDRKNWAQKEKRSLFSSDFTECAQLCETIVIWTRNFKISICFTYEIYIVEAFQDYYLHFLWIYK